MELDERDRAILRRYAADATFMAGGAAAILLQLADPRVAAGVARVYTPKDYGIQDIMADLVDIATAGCRKAA